MCDFCDRYSVQQDIPSLPFTMEEGDLSDGTTQFDFYVYSDDIPPSLCAVAIYSDNDADYDCAHIPIRYCPMCGAPV